jgi:hypothetical protein
MYKRPSTSSLSSESKKQHLTLNIKRKVDMIRKVDGGMPVKRLSDEFGIGVSIVNDIKSKKNSY